MNFNDLKIGQLIKIAADKDTFVNSGDEECWDANIEIWNQCYKGRNLEIVDLPMIARDNEEPAPHFEVRVVGGSETWVFDENEAELFEIV